MFNVTSKLKHLKSKSDLFVYDKSKVKQTALLLLLLPVSKDHFIFSAIQFFYLTIKRIHFWGTFCHIKRLENKSLDHQFKNIRQRLAENHVELPFSRGSRRCSKQHFSFAFSVETHVCCGLEKRNQTTFAYEQISWVGVWVCASIGSIFPSYQLLFK